MQRALGIFLILAVIYSVLYCCDFLTIHFYVGIFILSFMIMLWCALRSVKIRTAASIILGTYWLITFPLTICFAAIRIAMKDNISIELLQMFSLQSIHGLVRYHWRPLVFGIIFLLLLLMLAFFAEKKLFPQYKFKPAWNGIICFFIAIAVNLICIYCTSGPLGEKILELYKVRNIPVDYILNNGIEGIVFNRKDLSCTPGYNLVHIFLESTEQNYADPQKFPGLAPELNNAIKNSIHFSNIDMAPNANLTYGGIYASLKGFNITRFHILNNMRHQNILTGKQFVSMPDILHAAGYQQYFLYGHNSSFGGFNSFLASEHFHIKMLHEKQSQKQDSLQKADSIRDTELFEAAWQEFEKLSKDERPFSLTCLTVDAHAPNGICDSDKKFYRWDQNEVPQLLHAIHNTDRALGVFLKRIRESDAASKTVIVIQSDHLSHPYTPEIILNRLGNSRKMLFLIITPDKIKDKISVAGRTYDAAPTILHSMKVKHNSPFLLGRNLFMKKSSDEHADDEKQQKALEGAMFINADKDFQVKKHGISFHEKPYPHIKAGTYKIFIRSAASNRSDIPRAGECFNLEAAYSFEFHTLSPCDYDSIDQNKKSKNNFLKYYHNLIFGAEKDNSGFFFIYSSPLKTIKKKSKTFSDVTFDVDEIFN